MRKIKGWEFRAGIEATAHKVCSDLGLAPVTVGWSGISTAAINSGGQMMLANVADDAVVNQAMVNRYAGFVVHELLHRKFTNFRVSDHRNYVSSLHNACEDAWIERKAIAENLTGNVESLLTELVNTIVAESLTKKIDWSDPEAYPFALAVYARGFCKRVPVPAALVPVFDEATRRIDTCLNSQDTLAVAQWVFEQINKAAQQQQPDDSQEADQDGEGDQGQDGEGDGEGEGEGEGDQGASGEAEGGDQDGGNGKAGAGDQTAPEAPADAGKVRAAKEHSDAIEVEPTLKPQGEGGRGSYSKKHGMAADGYHVGCTRQHVLQPMQSGKLRYEVRKLFENSALEEWQINRKSGSLNAAALHTVATGNVAVFKRHHEEAGIDSAVVVVLDVSASMWAVDADNRTLISHAVNVCSALVDTLHRAGVAVSVITFGSRTSILKDWNTHPRKMDAQLPMVMSGGDTNDYFAIRYAHEMLHKRPEQRKVVFAITDGVGQPNDTRAQVDAGSHLGISTVGIGIQHDVQRVYPNAVRVDKLADMATASFKQIKLAA
jgi:Mg-chelatase subunit ChlD